MSIPVLLSYPSSTHDSLGFTPTVTRVTGGGGTSGTAPSSTNGTQIRLTNVDMNYLCTSAFWTLPSYAARQFTVTFDARCNTNLGATGDTFHLCMFRDSPHGTANFINAGISFFTSVDYVLCVSFDTKTTAANTLYMYNTDISRSNRLDPFYTNASAGTAWQSTSGTWTSHTVNITNNGTNITMAYTNPAGTTFSQSVPAAPFAWTLTTNSYIGFIAGVGGNNNPAVIDVRNFVVAMAPPTWSATSLYYEHQFVKVSTNTFILAGVTSSLGGSTPAARTSITSSGGWVKYLSSTSITQTNTLIANEVYYHPTLGCLCLSNNSGGAYLRTNYSNYSSNTVFQYGDQALTDGLFHVWFGSNATSNNMPPNVFNGMTSPTVANTWVTRWRPMTNVGTVVTSSANINVLWRGSLYTSKAAITYADTPTIGDHYIHPHQTTYWNNPTWANLSYAAGTFLKYYPDTNLTYAVGLQPPASNVAPSRNTTSPNGWVRVYDTDATILDLPASVQSYTANEFVFVPSSNSQFYAVDNVNLTVLPRGSNTTRSGWAQVDGPAVAGHYVYSSSNSYLANYVGSTMYRAWRTSTAFPALTSVGHFGEGFSTLYWITANTVPTSQNSDWNAWIPFWRSTTVKTYYQNNLTYNADRFYYALQSVTNSNTPLIDNSNLSGWIPIYNPDVPFYQNSYVFTDSTQAVYKTLVSVNGNYVNPTDDSNQTVYMLSSIPKTGPISLGSLQGVFFGMGMGRFDERYPWTPNQLPVLRWYNSSSGITLSTSNVVSWADSSSNNVPALAGALQPTYSNTNYVAHYNSEPYVMFTNSTQQKLTVDGLSTTSNFTVVMAAVINSTTQTRILFRASNIGLHATSGLTTRFSVYTEGEDYTRSAFFNYIGQPMIISFTGSWVASNIDIRTYVNGSLVDTLSGIPARPQFNFSNLTLGNDSTANNRGLGGGIAQFALFNQVLSTTDRQLVEGYMAWDCLKSGDKLNSHPYALIAPMLSNV